MTEEVGTDGGQWWMEMSWIPKRICWTLWYYKSSLSWNDDHHPYLFSPRALHFMVPVRGFWVLAGLRDGHDSTMVFVFRLHLIEINTHGRRDIISKRQID